MRPVLKGWRSDDPQLKDLVKSAEYREAFGEALDDDPLTVEPFKSYADKLRAAGLVTLDGIAALPYGLDATITPPVTRWLRRVGELGMAIAQDDDLKDWAITLASKLAARGIASQDEARATAGWPTR